MQSAFDWLGLVEAAYDFGRSEERWIEGIVRVAQPELDAGRGVFATIIDSRNLSEISYRALYSMGDIDPEVILTAQMQAKKEDIEAMWMRPVSTTSMMLGDSFADFAPIQDFGPPLGVRDAFGITARDPSGMGILLVSLLPRVTTLSARVVAHWERIAVHLATALRLRLALSERSQRDLSDGAEAILGVDGDIEHVEGAATLKSARRQLSRAAVAIDRARGPMRATNSERAVREWRGLVAARWSLVDHFDTDGRRYLVARQNEPNTRGPAMLTPRERQVVAFAALGHSNKLIAYELGIAHSTVKVLMARAAAKFGVQSRADLIRRFWAEK